MLAACRMALRALVILTALGALAYAVGRIPAELDADPIVSLSDRMVNGLDFDPVLLTRFEPFLAAAERNEACGPARRAVSVIRTYQTQQAAAAEEGRRAADNGQAALRNIRRKLACAPQDGLSWFTLFLLESSLSRRARANLPFLRFSYEVAPNEGQLMRTRSNVATALLPVVGPDLQAQIRNEFVLVARDDPRTAAAIILSSGEALRARLLPLIAPVKLESRAEIARLLDAEGSDVAVPGVPAQTGAPR